MAESCRTPTITKLLTHNSTKEKRSERIGPDRSEVKQPCCQSAIVHDLPSASR